MTDLLALPRDWTSWCSDGNSRALDVLTFNFHTRRRKVKMRRTTFYFVAPAAGWWRRVSLLSAQVVCSSGTPTRSTPPSAWPSSCTTPAPTPRKPRSPWCLTWTTSRRPTASPSPTPVSQRRRVGVFVCVCGGSSSRGNTYVIWLKHALFRKRHFFIRSLKFFLYFKVWI